MIPFGLLNEDDSMEDIYCIYSIYIDVLGLAYVYFNMFIVCIQLNELK